MAKEIKMNSMEEKLLNPTNVQNRFQEELQKKIKENKEYNDNVLSDKDKLFSHLEIVDGNILIRCLKFTGEQDNDGLLLERKFEAYTTAGGKPASKLEDWAWSPRAVIVKMPPQHYIDSIQSPDVKYRFENIKEGDIIWPSLQSMTGNYYFPEQRNHPVQSNEGYMYIPVTAIQMKEVIK